MFTLILKTIILLEKLTFKKLEIGDDGVHKFGIGSDKKLARKSKKSKCQKLAKFRNKSGYRNLSKFAAKEAEPSFLTFETKTTFNCLWSTFTKVSIF